MSCRQEDGWMNVYNGEARVGGVKLTEDGNILHLSHLYMEREAPAEALLILFRSILRDFKGRTIRAVVEGVPRYERLLSAYQKMGMSPYGILMEIKN